MIAITHAIFAWLLSVVFGFNPILTILASLAPDAEYILNTVHRGPLHSLILVIPACFIIWVYDREKGESVSAGVFSHLFLDSLTQMGIPLFYPLLTDYFSLYFYDSTIMNWLVIVVSLVLLVNSRKLFKTEFSRKILFSAGILWLLVLVTFKLFF